MIFANLQQRFSVDNVGSLAIVISKPEQLVNIEYLINVKRVTSITPVLLTMHIITEQETKHCLTNQGYIKCHNKNARKQQNITFFNAIR